MRLMFHDASVEGCVGIVSVKRQYNSTTIEADMSRTVFGKPEFRLAMNHTHITITRHDVGARRDPGTGEAPEPEPRAFDLGSPTLIADLRRLGAEIRAARGRLTVILPEGEVWRGRLALGEAKPRERGHIARAQ